MEFWQSEKVETLRISRSKDHFGSSLLASISRRINYIEPNIEKFQFSVFFLSFPNVQSRLRLV